MPDPIATFSYTAKVAAANDQRARLVLEDKTRETWDRLDIDVLRSLGANLGRQVRVQISFYLDQPEPVVQEPDANALPSVRPATACIDATSIDDVF